MKPQTFMNLSGEAVGNYARYHRLDPAEVLVVLDDAALPLGTSGCAVQAAPAATMASNPS